MENVNKMSAICFTGHRDISREAAYAIPSCLKKLLRNLIANGARTFLAGGAMGFDTIAALCVLELKEEYPDIRLELILPCRDQTKMWNEPSKATYNYILEHADRVEYLHERYTQSCMHDRNRRLVELCDVCVAYCIHSGGGTAYTVAHALSKGKELINIAELV
jgi:uncharacterized phage-like protein YoqJ